MLITKKSITYEIEPGFSIHDTGDYWNLVNAGRWEPETFDIMQKYLSKGYSYVDIGAWVGPTVLFGAQLAKKCYAIEADPVAYAGLVKNLSLNPGITNVNLANVAISSATGFAEIGTKITPGDGMSSLLWSLDAWTVPAFTLKDFFEQNKIHDCNFIKMDIEGGEFFVLKACREFFAEFQPTLYLSLHTPWIIDKTGFFSIINDSLSVYRSIYDPHGKNLSLNDLSDNPGFTTIIATNESV